MSSWSQKMKDPDFHKKYEINTNPVQGGTYIPKGTKVESQNRNNPNRFKVPNQKEGWSGAGNCSNGVYVEHNETEYTGLDAIAIEVMKKYDLPEGDHWHYFHTVKDALKEMYNKALTQHQGRIKTKR